MITELDQQTHDIDWFFTNDDKISFVASGGGKLPQSIAAMTLDSVNCKPPGSTFNQSIAIAYSRSN